MKEKSYEYKSISVKHALSEENKTNRIEFCNHWPRDKSFDDRIWYSDESVFIYD